MSGMNEIKIYGRLGRDPELKYTKNKEALCKFTLAEKIEGQEKPRWHNIVVWGDEAEHWSINLKKGSSIVVQGQKREREYTNDRGETKSYQEVKAHAIGLTKL